MNLRDVETLYWVVTLKSFDAAAKRLKITESAVSLRMKALEKSVERKLVHRNPCRLTPAGRRAWPTVERLLKTRNELGAAARGEPSPVFLRMGVIETVVHSTLPRLLAGLKSVVPNIQVQLTVLASRELKTLLEMGEIDLAIAASSAAGDEVQSAELGPMPMVLVGSGARYLKARYELAEVVERGVIAFHPDTPIHQECLKLIKEHTCNFVMHTGTSIAALNALLHADYGVATLPEAVATAMVARHRHLRVIPCRTKLPSLAMYVNWRSPPDEPHYDLIASHVRTIMGG